MKNTLLLLCTLIAGVYANSETMTLEQALARAREHSPELRAAQLHIDAAVQARAAAGLWINPKFEIEAEGLGWDNDLFSDGEYTVGLTQEFQLGRKQHKERLAAESGIQVARHGASEKAVVVIDAVRRAFIEVYSLQESAIVQVQQEELGRAFVDVARQRLKAGGGSELEVAQAELELEKILFSQTCCLGELVAARKRLASFVSLPEPEMSALSGNYYEFENVDAFEIEKSHPTLLRLRSEADQLRAEANYARATDVSNIKLGAGYKYEAAEEINTFVLSASVPLGIHKQGRALESTKLQQANAMDAEYEEARRALASALSEAQALFSGARAQAEMGKQKLIPKAERAYTLSREGYESGLYSWLELIAAQQHLAEIRLGYIEALKEAHLAAFTILKLKTEGI